MSQSTKTKHHHGDLKNALISAGLDILEESGLDGLSLRKCAAKAGVSHAAPAHHFGNLDGLKEAISARAFGLFRESMIQAAEAEGSDDRARLKGICRGYLRFGLNHKGLLDVMFGLPASAFLKASKVPDESDSYAVLREACAPFIPEGSTPEIVEVQVWSLIHGFTQLYTSGRFGDLPEKDADQGLFDQVIALLDSLSAAPS